MEVLDIQLYESILLRYFSRLEQNVLTQLNMKPDNQLTLSLDGNTTELITYMTFRLHDLSNDKVIEDSMKVLEDKFVKQIPETKTQVISQLKLIPCHDFSKMRIGFIVYFIIQPQIGTIKLEDAPGSSV